MNLFCRFLIIVHGFIIVPLQAAELPSRPKSPFYSVPLASHDFIEGEHDNKTNSSLIERVPPCRAFKIALDNIAAGSLKIDPFGIPNYILGQDHTVLCAQPQCEPPLILFVKMIATQYHVIRFLAQAEQEYFKFNEESLKRRHEALYHAVCHEDETVVKILLDNGAPYRGSHDLLAQLITNCRKREKIRSQIAHSARGTCSVVCSAPIPSSVSEDSAYNIAQLLVAQGASYQLAAIKALSTLCKGKSCIFLRKKYEYSDVIDRKSRESREVPQLRRSSPPVSNSDYVTMSEAENSDGTIEIYREEEELR